MHVFSDHPPLSLSVCFTQSVCLSNKNGRPAQVLVLTRLSPVASFRSLKIRSDQISLSLALDDRVSLMMRPNLSKPLDLFVGSRLPLPRVAVATPSACSAKATGRRNVLFTKRRGRTRIC